MKARTMAWPAFVPFRCCVVCRREAWRWRPLGPMAAPHSSLPGHVSDSRTSLSLFLQPTPYWIWNDVWSKIVYVPDFSRIKQASEILTVENWRIAFPKQLRTGGPHSKLQFWIKPEKYGLHSENYGDAESRVWLQIAPQNYKIILGYCKIRF